MNTATQSGSSKYALQQRALVRVVFFIHPMVWAEDLKCTLEASLHPYNPQLLEVINLLFFDSSTFAF